MVIVARDSTVRARKRKPVINEKQRLEVVKMLKPVDEAYLGCEGDIFKTVEKIKPDIIALGPDQDFDEKELQKELKKGILIVKLLELKNIRSHHLIALVKLLKRLNR